MKSDEWCGQLNIHEDYTVPYYSILYYSLICHCHSITSEPKTFASFALQIYTRTERGLHRICKIWNSFFLILLCLSAWHITSRRQKTPQWNVQLCHIKYRSVVIDLISLVFMQKICSLNNNNGKKDFSWFQKIFTTRVFHLWTFPFVSSQVKFNDDLPELISET